MKCPKCGCETPWLLYGGCPFCVVNLKKKRGHEEKVPLVDPWNPYMADDDGEKE